jgi:hypothetical protein
LEHERRWGLAPVAGLALLAALAACAPVAHAQVSPGPLAQAHAALDAQNQCFKCHARGGGMTARCLDCHTEIAALRNAKRGLHGRDARAQECATCHPDHAGRDFAMMRWEEGSAEAFDHGRTGWPLEGKHGKIACRECHGPKYQRMPMVSLIRKKDTAQSWVALETACQSCHSDPHKGGFGADCASCHETADWHRINHQKFNHDLTRYPLRGKHTAAACEKCHDPLNAWGKKPPFERCDACHQDVHAGHATLVGKPADCVACHSVNGFKPSTFTVEQHRRTAYPLEGKHAAVACAKCHGKGAPGSEATLGVALVLIRPARDRCASCHADVHGGQLAARPDKGACESCHRVSGFRPSTMTVAQHASLKLALEGRHAQIPCTACHAADRAGLTPPAGAARAGSARFVFKLAEIECIRCHLDPHQGRFAAAGARAKPGGCLACHDPRAFAPSRVDIAIHQTFAYPLEGAHRAVPCAPCHTDLAARAGRAGGPGSSLVLSSRLGTALTFAREKQDCAACHASPHGDQFKTRRDRGACEACHDLAAFKPARRFDHNRDAAFKLEGVHVRVACAKCHPAQKAENGTRVMYHGAPSRCESCHVGGGDSLRMPPPGQPRKGAS